MRPHVKQLSTELSEIINHYKIEANDHEQARKEFIFCLMADPAVRSLSPQTQERLAQEIQVLGLRRLYESV